MQGKGGIFVKIKVKGPDGEIRAETDGDLAWVPVLVLVIGTVGLFALMILLR